MRVTLPIMAIAWMNIHPCYLYSQNLVPNFSFEDTISCPTAFDQLNLSTYWYRPTPLGSSDFFHSCSPSVPSNFAGYQSPRTGNAYAGILAYTGAGDYREYAGIGLISALVDGKDYCVEFYVSRSDNYQIAVDRLGAVFSMDSLLGVGWLPLPLGPGIQNPDNIFITDTANWVAINGSFTAQGGEKFLTIGNFFYDIDTDTLRFGQADSYAYYYIDDVYVRLMDSIPAALHAGNDTTVCMGDSAALGAPPQSGYTYSWQGPGVSNATTSQLTVAPLQTSTYILTITDTMPKVYSCQPTKTDTVTVTVIDCDTLPEPANVVWLPNVFSPNGDGSNDVLYVRGNNIEELTFTIYNRWGEMVFQTTDISTGWDGTHEGQRCNSGVYVYRATGAYKDGTGFELKGNVSLVR